MLWALRRGGGACCGATHAPSLGASRRHLEGNRTSPPCCHVGFDRPTVDMGCLGHKLGAELGVPLPGRQPLPLSSSLRARGLSLKKSSHHFFARRPLSLSAVVNRFACKILNIVAAAAAAAASGVFAAAAERAAGACEALSIARRESTSEMRRQRRRLN